MNKNGYKLRDLFEKNYCLLTGQVHRKMQQSSVSAKVSRCWGCLEGKQLIPLGQKKDNNQKQGKTCFWKGAQEECFIHLE